LLHAPLPRLRVLLCDLFCLRFRLVLLGYQTRPLACSTVFPLQSLSDTSRDSTVELGVVTIRTGITHLTTSREGFRRARPPFPASPHAYGALDLQSVPLCIRILFDFEQVPTLTDLPLCRPPLSYDTLHGTSALVASLHSSPSSHSSLLPGLDQTSTRVRSPPVSLHCMAFPSSPLRSRPPKCPMTATVALSINLIIFLGASNTVPHWFRDHQAPIFSSVLPAQAPSRLHVALSKFHSP